MQAADLDCFATLAMTGRDKMVRILTKRTVSVIRHPVRSRPRSGRRQARDGTAPGPRCRRPSERPARWHPEGCPRSIRQPGQHLLAASRATRRPADNQVSAPMGSHRFPRCKGRFGSQSFLRYQATGDDEGPRGRRTPQTLRLHEAREGAGRFSRPSTNGGRRVPALHPFPGERRGPGPTSLQKPRARPGCGTGPRLSTGNRARAPHSIGRAAVHGSRLPPG